MFNGHIPSYLYSSAFVSIFNYSLIDIFIIQVELFLFGDQHTNFFHLPSYFIFQHAKFQDIRKNSIKMLIKENGKVFA